MENKPKKSKALIITIILIIILLVAGYLLFKNRDSFGIKTSAGIAKIFSPLIPSQNTKDLTQVEAQAGEDIKKGDSVSIFGTGTNNNPIVVKTGTNNGNIFGYANQDIKSGNMGGILKYNNNGSNGFWNSFSDFIGNIFNKKPICSDKKDNDGDGFIDEKDPNCHVGGVLTGDYVPAHYSESSNPIDGGNGNFTPQCSDTKDNDGDGFIDEKDPNCHVGGDLNKPYISTHYSESSNPIDGGNGKFPRVTVTANPKSVEKNGTSTISWASTDTKSCTLSGGGITGTGINNNEPGVKTKPLTSSMSYTVVCNGTINGSSASGNVLVTVKDVPPVGVPTVTAAANPPSIAKGGTSTIKWESTNATSCIINHTPVQEGDPQCGDGIDNDLDGLIDNNDPNCSLNGVFDPTRSEFNGQTSKSGSFPTGILEESKSYTVMCIGPGGNVSKDVLVTVGEDTLPDLIAGTVTPISAIVDTETTLSSIITNQGGGDATISFPAYFNIINNTDQSTTNIGVTIPPLPSNTVYVATTPYTFKSKDVTYSIRVCADKSDPGDSGKITESDEGNNCSGTTTLTVSGNIPEPCLSPKITNVSDGACIDPSECISPKVVNGDKCEDPTVCLPPKITNVSDGACIDRVDCKLPKVINGSNCEDATIDPGIPNKCLLIAQHPLEFTDSEKAKLAELLRKFYILSSTLKTDDDIAMIYQDIDKYKSLIGNIDDLTQQCYVQTNDGTDYTAFKNKNPNLNLPTWSNANGGIVFKTDGTILGPYSGLTLRGGNPWFNYDKRVSYIPDDNTIASFKTNNPSLDVPKSILSEKSTCGDGPNSLISYNSNTLTNANCYDTLRIAGPGVFNYLPPNTLISNMGKGCLGYMLCSDFYENYTYPTKNSSCAYQTLPNDETVATGCNFNPKTDIREYEKLLNIW